LANPVFSFADAIAFFFDGFFPTASIRVPGARNSVFGGSRRRNRGASGRSGRSRHIAACAGKSVVGGRTLSTVVIDVDIPVKTGLVPGGSIGKTLTVGFQRNRDVVPGICGQIASRSSGTPAYGRTLFPFRITGSVYGVFARFFGDIISARTISIRITPGKSG